VRRFREAESEHLHACEFPPCDFTSHHVCDGVDGFFLVLDTQHVIKISENGLINFTNIDFEGQSPANFKSKELLIYYSVRPSRPMETRW
jgi:hypothetical protein